jgi:hypothetical protein
MTPLPRPNEKKRLFLAQIKIMWLCLGILINQIKTSEHP